MTTQDSASAENENNERENENGTESSSVIELEIIDTNGSNLSDAQAKSSTNFPGHVAKKGRMSFFDTNQMDSYVLKFQPVMAHASRVRAAPTRRRSMLDTNPPLSRFNRFSLDTVPESIVSSSIPE